MIYTTKDILMNRSLWIDYKQSETNYSLFEFEGMKSKNSFHMIKSEQHKIDRRTREMHK